MRKVTPYLGAAISALAMAWSVAATAQGQPFKDVPTDHWAYQAVTDLQQKGIIKGYPDDYFRGKRTLTRYEFAVALQRALASIGVTAGPAGPQGLQGPPGNNGADGAPGPAGPPGMTPEEVARLAALTDQFKNELQSLGENIGKINQRLDELAKQIDAINHRLDRMPKIWGEFFTGFRGDQSRYGYNDYSGAIRSASPGLFANISSPSDFHLGVDANLAGGVKFTGDVVSSNYISYAGGGLGSGPAAVANAGLTQITTLYQANVQIPIKAFGNDTELTIGRYKEQVTPLTFWRPDYDAYFDLPWYNDGAYVQDGFEIKTKFGSAVTKVFGGSISSLSDGAGGLINQAFVGANGLSAGPAGYKPTGLVGRGQISATQDAGLHVAVPLFKFGEIGVTAVDFSGTGTVGGITGLGSSAGLAVSPFTTNPLAGVTAGTVGTTVSPFGNVAVYGANLKLKPIGHFLVSAEYSKSVTSQTLSTGDGQDNDDNNAYLVNVGYASRGLNIQGGYQHYDPRFAAPGYWNKIGNWYNPTGVQGPFARVSYGFTKSLQAYVGGDYLTGVHFSEDPASLHAGTMITRGTAGLKYNVNKWLNLNASYEGVFYDLSGADSNSGARAQPVEQYITLGAGLNLAANTVLKLEYQIENYQDIGGGFISNTPGGTTNAGTFVTQIGVHF